MVKGTTPLWARLAYNLGQGLFCNNPSTMNVASSWPAQIAQQLPPGLTGTAPKLWLKLQRSFLSLCHWMCDIQWSIFAGGACARRRMRYVEAYLLVVYMSGRALMRLITPSARSSTLPFLDLSPERMYRKLASWNISCNKP